MRVFTSMYNVWGKQVKVSRSGLVNKMFDVYPRGFISYLVGEEFAAFRFMHTVTLQDL